MTRSTLRALAVAAALGAAFFMAGCAGAGRSLDADVADRLLVEAKTPEERRLRLCLVGAAVAELGADRVLRFDPADGPAVDAAIAGFERRIRAIREARSSLWLNAEMYEVKRLFALAAEARLRGRIADVLADGVADLSNLRRAADALGKAGAIFADVDHAFERLHAGEIAPGRVWDACLGRIAWNRERIAGLVDL